MHYDSKVVVPQYITDSIALEAFSLTATADAIGKFFPAVLDAVKAGWSGVTALVSGKTSVPEDYKEIKLTKLEVKVLDKLTPEAYEYLAQGRVAIPEGFQGDIVKYVTNLDISVMWFTETTMKALEDFNVYCATVITNKSAKLSTKSVEHIYKVMSSHREKLNKQLADYFRRGSREAYVPFSKLVNGSDELKDYASGVHLLSNRLDTIDLNKVVELVKGVSDKLETLINMNNDGQISEMSPDVLKNLEKGSLELARQVEFFSVNYYRTLSVIEANKTLFSQLDDRMKKMNI